MLKLNGTDENFARLERARKLGEQKGGYSAVEVALAWLLHKPFPLVPIVGPHNPVELASCVKATSLSLSEEEIHVLRKLTDKLLENTDSLYKTVKNLSSDPISGTSNE